MTARRDWPSHYLRISIITDVTFHDTRHLAITRLSKVFNPLELARVVGHSNVNQLMTYYNESAAELAKKLG